MKLRNGFVSNSSSSSFVIAVKPGSDFLRLVEVASGYDTEIHAVGRNAVLQHVAARLRDDWEVDLDHPRELTEWEQQLYDHYQLLRAGALEGHELAVVEISLHQEILWEILETQERSGAVLVLHGEV